MANSAKVSVIVAIYNVDKFLEKCIISIIEQDYEDLEIILVDDNSTDSSGKICDNFAKRDKRIKVLHHKKNTRQSGVRNDGIKVSTGEYIIFVDGDDWLAKDHVSYMMKVIEKYDLDFGINLDIYTTRDLKDVSEKEIVKWTSEKATYELLWPNIPIGAWNKIYRRSFIVENNILFDNHLFNGEGLRFITDVSQRVKNIAVGNKRTYYYRLNNSESATTKYDVEQSLNALISVRGIKRDLVIESEMVTGAVDRHIWRNYFWNIRQIIAVDGKEKYKNEFKEFKKHLRKDAFKIIRIENNFRSKIFTFLVSLFPVSFAKLANKKFDRELKKDKL